MPSLKDLRNRIRSVQSTQKITQAMKMVAASKLRRAQEHAEAARPYAEHMGRLLSSITAGITNEETSPRLLRGSDKDIVHLIVVATADRGLCGPFNSSIVRAVRQHIQVLTEDGKTVKLICIGRKGRDMLRRDHGDKIIENIEFFSTRKVDFSFAQPIADRIINLFGEEEVDVCTIFYNRFRSVMSQTVTAHQLIPVEVQSGDESADSSSNYYEYEPDESEILEALLPRNISVQIYRALLENMASEQGARMTAMDSASRNAGEMIGDLTLRYNRTRQAMITKELIEIISGAEAV